jgi:HlyD family secretion protein
MIRTAIVAPSSATHLFPQLRNAMPKLVSTPLVVTAAIAVTTALLLAVSVQRIAQAQDSAPNAKAARPAMTVTTAKPASSTLPVTLAANGNIVAWQEASIGSLANGLQLREVRVNVGDRVKRGQLLASFGPETIEAELAQAEAAAAEADAARQSADADWAKARVLKDTGALSAQQISQYETATRTAAARVKAAEANVRAARVRLAHTRVVAPDDGVISARQATVGAVSPAGSELFRMIRQARLEWRAEVTSTQLGRIREGSLARLTAANGEAIEGRVRTIAPTVDPSTRLALVYVDLPANARVSAGMFAKGEFQLGETQAVTVPQQSVVLRDGFAFVFVVGANNKVVQRKVTAGRRTGDRIEILDGVRDNETVAAMGAGFLTDGDTVRVTELPPSPAAPPTTPAKKAATPSSARNPS